MAEQGPLSNSRLGDKYLLGALLGQGGFGAVYQAEHILLHRQQAIKILLEQHWSLPKFRERFLREAQTLAALDHPNIVHVDDFGFDGHRAYLVMPYIGGGDVQRLLRRRGPLPPEEIARYLEQVCSALDYAHARNVAHLDLKPLNLLVHEDGRLLLSDFGLAHLLEQGAIEGSTSLQFGTPTYMAPEHLQGQPERRSDLYALGIILYQMLSGRVPFEGSNAAAIMLKHLTEPPPPPRSFRPDLPLALDGVLSKALAKRAPDRYQTAGALLAAFQGALGKRVSAPEAGWADVPTRPSRPPLATTQQAAKPPAAVDGEEATLQATPEPREAGDRQALFSPGGLLSRKNWSLTSGALTPLPRPLTRRQEPGGLLSRKSVQRLSLSALAVLLLSVGMFIFLRDSGYNLPGFESISAGIRGIGLWLTLLLWVLGLLRTARMKARNWLVALLCCSPLIAYLVEQNLHSLLSGYFFYTVQNLSFLVTYLSAALLIPLLMLVQSRRS